MTAVIGIAGWSGSGKTTLAERLIRHFADAGLRVATIKHTHHAFDMDKPGSDSARLRSAGAVVSAIVSNRRVAIVEDVVTAGEPSLEEVIERVGPADLVIVEGYKSAAIPKIETRRESAQQGHGLAPADRHVIAVAADHDVPGMAIPVLDLNDVAGIAGVIERAVGPFKHTAAA